MAIGKFALQFGPLLAVLGVFFIIYRSAPRQRIALGLAWAFPGAGHFWLGERQRGLLFSGSLVGVFLVGLLLSEFGGVSPFDRHELWGLAQIPGGMLTVLTWLATMGVVVDSYDGVYQIGSLYIGTACLLNILAMCDAWDIAGGHLEGGSEPAAGTDAPATSGIDTPEQEATP